MALLETRGDRAVVIPDRYTRLGDEDPIPTSGPVLVSLERFESEKDSLGRRGHDLGVWLRSEQSPMPLARDLDRLALIALDFPIFSDGRAYSSARILRERLGWKGELRAIGDVLCEQLTFMLRSGFDTFDMASPDAVEEFASVISEVRVVYQHTGDGQATASDLRADPGRAALKRTARG